MTGRPGGHRRGTSEFIGGDGKSGSGLGLLSTSPTKGDGALPSPTGPPPSGPSAGRRGHAHRRSAALSSHDLSMIVKPSTPAHPRAGSAPSSPADQVKPSNPFPSMTPTATAPGMQLSPTLESPRASTPEGSPPGKALNRVRVGFSDTLEFIPRPLSLVSSDTSSTVTTQKGHSVTGSLSSIVSSGTSSPSSKEHQSLASSPSSPKAADGRPRTAGSVLDGAKELSPALDGTKSPRRQGSNPLLVDEPLSSSGRPATPKLRKWSFFGHESAGEEASPSRSRPVSASSSAQDLQSAQSVKTEVSPPQINVQAPDDAMPPIEPTISRRSTGSKKHTKKQKKVKSWAGSILSRKPRPRGHKPKAAVRRSLTPPPPASAPMVEYNRNIEPSFISASHSDSSLPVTPEIQTDYTTWKPKKTLPPDDDAMSPIIDLDAALGPFRTPKEFNSFYDPQFEASQKTGSSKRRMHSAAGMGGFIGPGMHYHRRAESAPEMVPFDYPRFGINRLGSSSTMADVFEEDEEDEWEDSKGSDKDSETKVEIESDAGLGIDIKIEEAADVQTDKAVEEPPMRETTPVAEIRRKGSALSEGSSQQSNHGLRSENSSTSLKDEPIREESSTQVEIADDSLPPRPHSHSRAPSSNSAATPPFRARVMKELSPVEVQNLALQPPFLTPTSPFSTTQSSFPSPRSPFSYDAYRVSTAASSVTDENAFQMLLLGEPGPEVRMSVDDVPSLSSGRSTITKESMNPGANNPQFRDGQRSASFSAAVSRKRSSMASLSRLISSSHGERSKLSIESRPESLMEGEKKDKTSKTKRISRLMQFWKPKETS